MFGNYVVRYLYRDLRWQLLLRQDVGPGQQQKPLEQLAVDLQMVAGNTEAENPKPGFEDRPEIQNSHDQHGPIEIMKLNKYFLYYYCCFD